MKWLVMRNRTAIAILIATTLPPLVRVVKCCSFDLRNVALAGDNRPEREHALRREASLRSSGSFAGASSTMLAFDGRVVVAHGRRISLVDLGGDRAQVVWTSPTLSSQPRFLVRGSGIVVAVAFEGVVTTVRLMDGVITSESSVNEGVPSLGISAVESDSHASLFMIRGGNLESYQVTEKGVIRQTSTEIGPSIIRLVLINGRCLVSRFEPLETKVLKCMDSGSPELIASVPQLAVNSAVMIAGKMYASGCMVCGVFDQPSPELYEIDVSSQGVEILDRQPMDDFVSGWISAGNDAYAVGDGTYALWHFALSDGAVAPNVVAGVSTPVFGVVALDDITIAVRGESGVTWYGIDPEDRVARIGIKEFVPGIQKIEHVSGLLVMLDGSGQVRTIRDRDTEYRDPSVEEYRILTPSALDFEVDRVRGRLLILWSGGIQQWSLVDGAAELIRDVEFEFGQRMFRVSGDKAFIVTNECGPAVIDINTQDQVILLACEKIKRNYDDVFGLAVDENYVYVADGRDGLRVLGRAPGSDQLSEVAVKSPGDVQSVVVSDEFILASYVDNDSDGNAVYGFAVYDKMSDSLPLVKRVTTAQLSTIVPNGDQFLVYQRDGNISAFEVRDWQSEALWRSPCSIGSLSLSRSAMFIAQLECGAERLELSALPSHLFLPMAIRRR